MMDWLKQFIYKDTDQQASLELVKGTDDQLYIFGIYSNKYKDRDGDIIPYATHQAYVDWVTKTGFKPALTLHHQPHMPSSFWLTSFKLFQDDIPILQKIVDTVYADVAVGKVEKVFTINGFAGFVASVKPGMEEAAEKLVNYDNIGMSHGFILTENEGNLLKEYFSYEFSGLPLTRAANIFTGFLKGKSMSKIDQGETRDFLVDLLGEEKVTAAEDKTAKAQKSLDPQLEHKSVQGEVNMATKNDQTVEEEVVAAEETEPVVEEEVVEAAEEETQEEVTEDKSIDYNGIRDRIFKDLDVDGLMELQSKIFDRLESLEAVVKEQKQVIETQQATIKELSDLKLSEDEKIARNHTAISWENIGYSPTKSVETEALEDVDMSKAPTGSQAATDELGRKMANLFGRTAIPQL